MQSSCQRLGAWPTSEPRPRTFGDWASGAIVSIALRSCPSHPVLGPSYQKTGNREVGASYSVQAYVRLRDRRPRSKSTSHGGRPMKSYFRNASFVMLSFGALITVCSDASARGAVYTMTNAASGNDVVAFVRQHDGTLIAAGSVSTGGKGSGDGLGSQGAMVRS